MKKKTKKTKSIIRILLITIAAAVVGLNIYAMNASKLAGNDLPMPFGIGVAVVISGSMEPEYSVGDLIFVKKCDNYSVRDVIVYQDGRIFVTHRIVSMDGDEIVTKGDANNTEDKPITLDQIRGRVAFAIPAVGYIVNVVKSPIGTLVLVGLAVLLMELSFRSEKENDKKKIEEIKAEIERLKQK